MAYVLCVMQESVLRPIGCIQQKKQFSKAHNRLEIKIEIGLEFNQSEERKPISSLVIFALIGQNPI